MDRQQSVMLPHRLQVHILEHLRAWRRRGRRDARGAQPLEELIRVNVEAVTQLLFTKLETERDDGNSKVCGDFRRKISRAIRDYFDLRHFPLPQLMCASAAHLPALPAAYSTEIM